MKAKIVLAIIATSAFAFANIEENIEMPYVPFEIKMGKNFDTVQANCLTCHSFGYILNQGKQSRAFWEEKVVKMVHAFKAPIGSEDQTKITEYLFEQYGNGKER